MKTAAAFQEIDLVAVDVEAIGGGGFLELDVIGQRGAGAVGKSGSDGFASAAVALGADVDLQIAGERARRQGIFVG